MARGFLYLVAVMDWVSGYVLAWRLSNLLDTSFCVAALEEALSKGRPEIFNTDQGSQFTDENFTAVLHTHEVAISIGRSRGASAIIFLSSDFGVASSMRRSCAVKVLSEMGDGSESVCRGKLQTATSWEAKELS
jgi:transposase InsO family protein